METIKKQKVEHIINDVGSSNKLDDRLADQKKDEKTTISEMSYLLTLPDIVYCICRFLDINDVKNMRFVCKESGKNVLKFMKKNYYVEYNNSTNCFDNFVISNITNHTRYNLRNARGLKISSKVRGIIGNIEDIACYDNLQELVIEGYSKDIGILPKNIKRLKILSKSKISFEKFESSIKYLEVDISTFLYNFKDLPKSIEELIIKRIPHEVHFYGGDQKLNEIHEIQLDLPNLKKSVTTDLRFKADSEYLETLIIKAPPFELHHFLPNNLKFLKFEMGTNNTLEFSFPNLEYLSIAFSFSSKPYRHSLKHLFENSPRLKRLDIKSSNVETEKSIPDNIIELNIILCYSQGFLENMDFTFFKNYKNLRTFFVTEEVRFSQTMFDSRIEDEMFIKHCGFIPQMRKSFLHVPVNVDTLQLGQIDLIGVMVPDKIEEIYISSITKTTRINQVGGYNGKTEYKVYNYTNRLNFIEP